jgi:hypothetical protein
MVGFIILAAIVGAVLWRTGLWPFDRNYPMLTKYSDRGVKPAAAPATKTDKPAA